MHGLADIKLMQTDNLRMYVKETGSGLKKRVICLSRWLLTWNAPSFVSFSDDGSGSVLNGASIIECFSERLNIMAIYHIRVPAGKKYRGLDRIQVDLNFLDCCLRAQSGINKWLWFSKVQEFMKSKVIKIPSMYRYRGICQQETYRWYQSLTLSALVGLSAQECLTRMPRDASYMYPCHVAML